LPPRKIVVAVGRQVRTKGHHRVARVELDDDARLGAGIDQLAHRARDLDVADRAG